MTTNESQKPMPRMVCSLCGSDDVVRELTDASAEWNRATGEWEMTEMNGWYDRCRECDECSDENDEMEIVEEED